MKEKIMTTAIKSSKTSNDSQNKLTSCIKNMSDSLKLKFWIKTLICTHGVIPEIIKPVDKMIELQASNITFSSSVFNKKSSTYDQVESVIDLRERINKLLNIYIIGKKITENLTVDDHEFLARKYIYNWSAEEMADYYACSIRTIYRKIDKLINSICEYCATKNWSLKFIESQTKCEGWIKDQFIKTASEYFKNTNYKET